MKYREMEDAIMLNEGDFKRNLIELIDNPDGYNKEQLVSDYCYSF